MFPTKVLKLILEKISRIFLDFHNTYHTEGVFDSS